MNGDGSTALPPGAIPFTPEAVSELGGARRHTQRGSMIDSHRATCTECVWADAGNDPEVSAVGHVLAFGHDVTVSHVRIDVVSLRPKGETTK